MMSVDIPVGSIRMERALTRSDLDQEVDQLATSITAVGLLSPILVERVKDDVFTLVAGRRRLRACCQLGMKTIPCIVLSDLLSIPQVQLVENLQRADLNPMDRAVTVQAFMMTDNLTKAEAARRIGVPRTTLTDWLDILEVGPKYQKAVINNHNGGSSPLTTSHISLAKRFAAKMRSESMLEVALDTILYYGLTRAETKKVLEMVATRTDCSLEKAVTLVRKVPRMASLSEDGEPWDVRRLVEYLAQSGDYLVKCKPAYLESLTAEERHEVLRQSRALQRLLREIEETLPEDEDSPASKIS